MEDNKKIKISLTTLIFFIIIFVFLIAVIAFIFLKYLAKNKVTDIKPSVDSITSQLHDEKNKQDKDFANLSDFSFNFLKIENNKENMIYSPLSIKYALKMLEDGAEGDTKKQIENVIGNEKWVKYNNIEDILSLANSLYIRDSYKENIKAQ